MTAPILAGNDDRSSPGVLQNLLNRESEFHVVREAENGAKFPFELPVKTAAAGADVRYSALIRDLSEKTKLQQRVIDNEHLAAIGIMAAKLVHEIANPINSMYLTAQLLENLLGRRKGDPVSATANRLTSEIKRLDYLLQDFSSLSRCEQYGFASVDLVGLTKEVLEMERIHHKQQGIDVKIDFAEDFCQICGDKLKLKQALLNLCKNACEAMIGGGSLSVRGSRSGEEIVLEVEDTGVGIPAGINVFEPFITTKSKGTGLGLMIVREIIAAHQGRITYHSEPGKGTLFRINLPIVRQIKDGET